MSLIKTTYGIEYPDSDGKPMGETDLHRDWMIHILELLRYRYREQRVYVASDLLLYYEEGEPTKFVVPDDFVVLDCDPGRRRVFKTWEEPRVPNVVFEVTSRGTRREDHVFKPEKYAEIGIAEYFLYDPSAEYLDPCLQGFRLDASQVYRPIESHQQSRLESEQLGIQLWTEDSSLVMCDAQTGEVLLTAAEAASARAEQLEAEVQRLREELSRRDLD